MSNLPVTIFGYYGEAWLESLEGSAVGPSSARYSFDTCELVSELADGSALVRSTNRVDTRNVNLHLDGSVCRNYPCSLDHTRAMSIRRSYSTGLVPAGNWKLGGRGLLPESELR